MSDADALAAHADIRRRIAQFVAGASTEITTHDAPLVPALAAQWLPGSTIYVAHTPKATLDEVVDVSLVVQAHGLKATPHIVARRLPDERTLHAALLRLSAAGVDRLLIIAGDLRAPVGPFGSSLDVMESGILDDGRFARIAFAGHPEGHALVAAEPLWDALRRKQHFADRTGIEVHLVTQFGFNAQVIHRWQRDLHARGIRLPLHVGIAGPTPIHKLLKFAVQCGVGASLHSALRNSRSVGNLVGTSTAHGEMVTSLVRLGAGTEQSGIKQPHFFTFGGALASAQWMRAVREGHHDLCYDRT